MRYQRKGIADSNPPSLKYGPLYESRDSRLAPKFVVYQPIYPSRYPLPPRGHHSFLSKQPPRAVYYISLRCEGGRNHALAERPALSVASMIISSCLSNRNGAQGVRGGVRSKKPDISRCRYNLIIKELIRSNRLLMSRFFLE